jgi:signal transducer and activator of transcription 5B
LLGDLLCKKSPKPLVTAKLLSESQAHQLKQTNQVPNRTCGDISHNSSNMDYHNSQHLSSKLDSMVLPEKVRKEKSNCEKIADLKFALLFQSTFTIDELTYRVWTLSLPTVVASHVKQEPDAWGTILWDNAFSEFDRIPFVVPEKVPWNRLAVALNNKFRSQTGRSLTAENLHFLCEKALKRRIASPITDDVEISCTQFLKDYMPQQTFTFWQWFYDTLKLTHYHLKQPWAEGLILGFVDKQIAESYLVNREIGTFLLRFSDSTKGSVSLSGGFKTSW